MPGLLCGVCRQDRPGRKHSFYITLIRDGVRLHRRLYVCLDDLELLTSNYGRNWSDGFVLNKFSETAKCSQCGVQRGTDGSLHPMYVTAYSSRNLRHDYYAAYCPECAQTLIDTFELAEEYKRGA